MPEALRGHTRGTQPTPDARAAARPGTLCGARVGAENRCNVWPACACVSVTPAANGPPGNHPRRTTWQPRRPPPPTRPQAPEIAAASDDALEANTASRPSTAQAYDAAARPDARDEIAAKAKPARKPRKKAAAPAPAADEPRVTFKDAAEQVLRAGDGPMKVKAIAAAAVPLVRPVPQGKTPAGAGSAPGRRREQGRPVHQDRARHLRRPRAEPPRRRQAAEGARQAHP